MNRKRMTVELILLLIAAITVQGLGTSVVHTSEISSSTIPRGGFGLDSVIYISWDASGNEEPLEPGGAPRSVNLTVSYSTVLVSPCIGRIILLYCIVTHQYVTVSLEIGNIPSWSTASLSDTELRFPISSTESSQIISVTVTVDEQAPAYGLCSIPILASVGTVRGPFGVLSFVNECSQTATMNFLPGYHPHIIVEPASDYLNVTPGNTSYLPITITNLGNGRTVVFVNIVGFPSGDWLISIPHQIVFEVNMSQEITLAVVPPSDFNGTDTIGISFTPHNADDYSQHGEPVNITIDLICEP